MHASKTIAPVLSPLPPLTRPSLKTLEAGDWLLEAPERPSEAAIELLADELWERRGATGRHLVIYGLPELYASRGWEPEDRGRMLDAWASAAYLRHAARHAVRAELSTANRPLGGLSGSLDYVKSFIPEGRTDTELLDLRRGLRFQGMLLQRDLAAACEAVGESKADYLARTPRILDDTLDSIKVPHTDAGTTISTLHIDQDGVEGGRSQLTDVRGLLEHLNRGPRLGPPWTVLDLLAPLRKQGVYRGHAYATDVVLALKPEYRELAQAYTLTIPDPARAITFFVNDLFDRVTGKLSAILHGAEPPSALPSKASARRLVMNRAVLAQIA